MAKENKPPSEKSAAKNELKGADGIAVRLPTSETGPRKWLCQRFKLDRPNDVDLFLAARAEIERLDAEIAKLSKR